MIDITLKGYAIREGIVKCGRERLMFIDEIIGYPPCEGAGG